MLQKEPLQFLKNLRAHNDKEWFAAHRDQYEAAHADFVALATEVLQATARFDASVKGLDPEKSVLRIYRDLRFTKDKTPFHPAFRLGLGQEGKTGVAVGYYLHMEPGHSFLAGGLQSGTSADVKKVRQEIHYNWEEFQKLLHAKPFQTVFGDLEKGPAFSLKRPPRGYDEQDPAIDYLKLKSFVARHSLSDADLLAGQLTVGFKAVHPLLDFLNRDLR